MRFYGATPAPLYGGGYAGFGQSWVGATPAAYYQGGMAALGVVVPTPLPGQQTYAPDMKETGYNYCGSKFGFQQMLKDLGFYKGTIDGQVGQGTINAAAAFGKQYGVPISGGLSNTFCGKLIQVWSSKFSQPAPAPAPQPPSQDVPPPPEGRPNSGQPPAPRNGEGTKPGNQNGNGATAAPGGAVANKAKGWWASQSTGTKAGVAIGSVAVLGLLGYAIASSGGASRKRS